MRRPEGTVTMLFTDIEGSTRLARALGESWPAVLRDHHVILTAAITDAGGFVNGIEGDGFFATFAGAPTAVEAAVTAQRTLRRHVWPSAITDLRVRMGIHTAPVAIVDDAYVGIEVHRAARVAAAAHGGQILLTAEARRAIGAAATMEDLGLHRLKDFPDPVHLFHLVVDDDRPAEWFPPPRSVGARPTNLPATDRPLFGRDGELASIAAEFARGERLVTLTGTGGAGKTSVALAAARAALADWAAGAWIVWGEGLSGDDDLAAATASVLRVTDPLGGTTVAALAERLDGVDVLVVLDNLEHLPAAPAQVREMLDRVPTLRVLATSRAPLRVHHERIQILGPLDPEASVALLADRARATGGDLDLADGATAGAANALASMLDHLPLALELAAARLRVLGPVDLLSRVTSALDLATDSADRPTRHRSLRATVEWSLALLPAPARRLFARLAVFSAPAPLDLIETVCASPGLDVVDGMVVLVDHSLVRRSPTGFGLVAAIQEIAAERLASAGEVDEFRHRHAATIAALVDARNLESRGGPMWSDEALEAEVWTAVTSTRGLDPALHRRLVLASATRWAFNGRVRTLHGELTAALAEPSVPLEDRGRLLLEHGFVQMHGGDRDAAIADVEEALPLLAGRSGDDRAGDLVIASFVFEAAGDHPRSLAMCEAAVEASRSGSDPVMQVRSLVNLAQALIANGRASEAGPALDDALRADCEGHAAHEIAQYRADWYRAMGWAADSLRLYLDELRAGWMNFAAWSFAGIALGLGDLGATGPALEVGAIAVAEAKSLFIDVAGLTQFGESLPEAMERWRAAMGAPGRALEARGTRTEPAERTRRVIELAAAALPDNR